MYAYLLTLEWGDSSSLRICSLNEPIEIGTDEFASHPKLKPIANTQHGGTDDAPWSFEAASLIEPFASLISPELFPKVTALLQEMRVGDEDSLRDLFGGTIGDVVKNPNGKAGLIRCPIVGVKARLKGKLGLPMLTTCPWVFANGRPCKATRETVATTISEINTTYPNVISTTGGAWPGFSNLYWEGGHVIRDGLAITIRESRGSGVFDLRDRPPASWLNQSVTFNSGCGKEIVNCRFYDQEENFGGSGFAMPSANPLFQTR